MTDILKNQYLAYYNKLGIKRKEGFYKNICIYCREKLKIDPPIFDNLFQFLEDQNLLYMVYFGSFE